MEAMSLTRTAGHSAGHPNPRPPLGRAHPMVRLISLSAHRRLGPDRGQRCVGARRVVIHGLAFSYEQI
jgi:hypothetical protein